MTECYWFASLTDSNATLYLPDTIPPGDNPVTENSNNNDAPEPQDAAPDSEESLAGNGETSLPVLAMKHTVVFPFTISPLAVGRPLSLAAAEVALASEEKTVLLLTQRDPDVEQPTADDLFTVGTRAVIKRMSRGDGGAVHLLAQGINPVRVQNIQQADN